jgi:hypothetical protein
VGDVGLDRVVRRKVFDALNAAAARTIDPEFARDQTLGQTLVVRGKDKVYHGHFEQIRQNAAQEKGDYSWSLSVES